MDGRFTEHDDGRRFRRLDGPRAGRTGKLEYPLLDQGIAKEGQGVLWYDRPTEIGYFWDYVGPEEVEPVSATGGALCAMN